MAKTPRKQLVTKRSLESIAQPKAPKLTKTIDFTVKKRPQKQPRE